MEEVLLGNTLTYNYVIVAGILAAAIVGTAVTMGVEVWLEKVLTKETEAGSPAVSKISQFRHTATWLKRIFVVSILLILLVGFGWPWLQEAGLEGHVIEWLNLMVRWVHITFGIAWIGASFYFTWLEMSLNRTENLRDGIAGDLWAVHGGGFYFIEKYKVGPPKLPKKLHWFKYEAYFTWVSGFTLLVIVYYLNTKMFLVDPAIMDLTPFQAIGIGVGTMVVSWIIYDQLCKSPIVDKPLVFGLILFAFLTAVAFFFTQVFNPRGAYIHVGAVIGTLMAGNVFFGIIPAQKAMVEAYKKGLPLDPKLGKNAGRRSLHNNYLTLPILFIMISNHFPSTFGHEWNWAVLAGLSFGSVIFKHFLNLYDKGDLQLWLVPVAALIMIALAMVTAPKISTDDAAALGPPVTFAEVDGVITLRCKQCHAAAPTDDIYKIAPNGVMYDTPEQIASKAATILQRAVITQSMPPANKTGITDEERELLKRWILQGAKID